MTVRFDVGWVDYPGDPEDDGVNLENVWYAYNAGGHCKRIVKNYPSGEQGLPDPADWFVTDLEYDLDQHLWLVRKFTCGKDQNGDIENAVFTVVREFRYDSDRGRYLVRDCSPDPARFARPIGDRWTEYLGDEPHRDFEVDVTGTPPSQTATAVPVRRYIRGYGLIATEDENGNMQFVHGDLLGSTRLLTEGSDAQSLGDPTARGEYLAFGGVLDLSSLLNGRGGTGGPGSSGSRGGTGILPVVPIRYGWCGSWGYQNDALEDLGAGGFGGGVPSEGVPTGGTPTLADDESELGLLHIGARYYSPEIGRWVQRDPIGVDGGVNCYTYAWNNSLTAVDPEGLAPGYIEIGISTGIRAMLVALRHGKFAEAMKLMIGVAYRVQGSKDWLTYISMTGDIGVLIGPAPAFVFTLPVRYLELIPGSGTAGRVNCLFTAVYVVGKGRGWW